MSRSGYTDEWDEYIAMWRGQVASATRGRRGQRFFRDLVAALDALPERRLVADTFGTPDGPVCALGAIAKQKGTDFDALDRAARNEDFDALGDGFDIARQLAQEVMWINDEAGPIRGETDEARWLRVRTWATRQIRVREDELLPDPTSDTGAARLGKEG